MESPEGISRNHIVFCFRVRTLSRSIGLHYGPGLARVDSSRRSDNSGITRRPSPLSAGRSFRSTEEEYHTTLSLDPDSVG